ncbi:synaptonemal complex protein 1-like isoform X3 [Lethenteron reissneri]|uniref:synaptonemal complex protein 1-like isoform X3 n=1 Tax=Lethenteron reissneri TaxID=7753 RepID=UPI002AB7DCE0|nr:synaptonemal complex protein 1-like isoform X3 [Lethenteron reissneri]
MEGNDNEFFSINLASNFSPLQAFDIQSILGIGSDNKGMPEQGHRQSLQGQRPSTRGQSQPGKGGSQLRQGHGQLSRGRRQPVQGWGQTGQGKPREGHGEAIKGYNQPGQRQYHDRTKKTQLDRGQTQPKQGQRQPEQGQRLPGHVHGLLRQGRGQPNKALSQPKRVYGPQGKVQEPSGHAWGQRGQGQMSCGRDKPGQGRGETGQVQQGQAQRTLLQAPAKNTEQHQPQKSTLLFDEQEHKSASEIYRSLCLEIDKVIIWKIKVECVLNNHDKALREAQETIDALRNTILEIQFENENLSVKLQDMIKFKQELIEKIRGTRKIRDDVKGQFATVKQILKRAEAEMESIAYAHLLLKEEMKIIAVTLNDLNLNSQNDKNIALDQVEEAVQEMGRAQRDFITKLTVKERQVKEISELLESKYEELKTTSQKLQYFIENCVRLTEIKCNFQTLLEQAQEEINTLKLEINRRQEVESTLQVTNPSAEMQNIASSFAEKERAYIASTMELQQLYDNLQHEHQDLHVIVQNLENANEELTRAANQRCSEDAEIRSRFEANIREKNAEIDNMKIESDNNNAKHKQLLESLDMFKQEGASFQETICQMNQQIAAMETLINESKSEFNAMQANECALENDRKDALKAATVLESELCQERECHLDTRNKVGAVILKNEELTELCSRLASQINELNNIIETTKRNEDALQFNIQKLESNYKNLEEELESSKEHHQAQLEAHIQTETNLGHELDKQREEQCEEDSCYENKMKDFESEMDSLKQQYEQERNNAMAKLADCRVQIKKLEEIKLKRISAEIERVKINAEKISQFKITEMTAMVEEYKRQCDQNLEDKNKEYSSLDQKYKDALENVSTLNKANADEMRAEIEKLKEELKQKLAVTPKTSKVTPAKRNRNTPTPVSVEKMVLRKSSRCSVGIITRVTQASPLPAPVTVAKSASRGILKPLAMGNIINKKRKVDEQLMQSISGVMPSKRTEKTKAASKISKQSQRDMSRVLCRIDQNPSIFFAKPNKAIGISRKTTLTRKAKQGKIFSALPPIKPPAKQRDTTFNWLKIQDVYTFGPED